MTGYTTEIGPTGLHRVVPAPRVRHAAEGNQPTRPTRTRTFECAVCYLVVTVRGLGASNERRYCNAICRERAWIAIRAERRRAGRVVAQRSCEACQAPLPLPPKGQPSRPTQRFCSSACESRMATRRWRAAHAA